MKQIFLDLLARWRTKSANESTPDPSSPPAVDFNDINDIAGTSLESSAPVEPIAHAAPEVEPLPAAPSVAAEAPCADESDPLPTATVEPIFASRGRRMTAHEEEIVVTLAEIKEILAGTEWSKLMRNARDGGATSILACRVLDKTMALLSHGYKHVELMLDAAQDVRTTTNQLATVAEDIKKVSNQTRIVSINAGIEANRAGVHGRTFQVVALQMTNLSDDTRKLTADIDSKLVGVNEKINVNRELCIKVGKLFGDMHKELGEFKKMMMRVEELSTIQVEQLDGIETILIEQPKKKKPDAA